MCVIVVVLCLCVDVECCVFGWLVVGVEFEDEVFV